MSHLKPSISKWLHNVWKELRSKETMILKGCEETWFTIGWNGDFQLATMEANKTYFSIYNNT